MHLSTFVIVLFAALASASFHLPPARVHQRQFNATSSGAPQSRTTLTVSVTDVLTVTSCASSITNCPARTAVAGGSDDTPVYVTTTVAEYTVSLA